MPSILAPFFILFNTPPLQKKLPRGIIAFMYSDTHFHFSILREEDGWTRQSVLEKMLLKDVKFALDIGTDCDDLKARQELFEKTFALMEEKTAASCKDFIYFTAGIWPDPESIKNRSACLNLLKKNILDAKSSSDSFKKKVCALGECGLDHHWNPSGADGRSQDDFDQKMIEAERELFMMQLELAKELDLPVIVHSRDAAQETIGCIKESGWGHKCVIHCYSYGLEEARSFLDLGSMISFSGSVTYAKKSQAEEKRALMALVPNDRILVETDAPYLAPVPMRGKANNPTYIEWTYKCVAAARETQVESLCQLVEENAKKFFAIL